LVEQPLRSASSGQIADLRRGKCHGGKSPKEAEGCRKSMAYWPLISTPFNTAHIVMVEGR
jgi:hypothetical protein